MILSFVSFSFKRLSPFCGRGLGCFLIFFVLFRYCLSASNTRFRYHPPKFFVVNCWMLFLEPLIWVSSLICVTSMRVRIEKKKMKFSSFQSRRASSHCFHWKCFCRQVLFFFTFWILKRTDKKTAFQRHRHIHLHAFSLFLFLQCTFDVLHFFFSSVHSFLCVFRVCVCRQFSLASCR